MKRAHLLPGLLAALLCLGLPALWAWREVRQERLDEELLVAIYHGERGRAVALLDQGANPDATDRRRALLFLRRLSSKITENTPSGGEGLTALMIAADMREVGLVAELLHRGAHADVHTSDGTTALGLAQSWAKSGWGQQDPAVQQMINLLTVAEREKP